MVLFTQNSNLLLFLSPIDITITEFTHQRGGISTHTVSQTQEHRDKSNVACISILISITWATKCEKNEIIYSGNLHFAIIAIKVSRLCFVHITLIVRFVNAYLSQYVHILYVCRLLRFEILLRLISETLITCTIILITLCTFWYTILSLIVATGER